MGIDYRVSVLYGWKIPAETTEQILEIDDFFEKLEEHLFFANAYTDYKDQDCVIGIELNRTDDFGFLEVDCGDAYQHYISLIETIPQDVINILQEKNIDITKTNIYIMHQIW